MDGRVAHAAGPRGTPTAAVPPPPPGEAAGWLHLAIAFQLMIHQFMQSRDLSIRSDLSCRYAFLVIN